MSRSFLSPLIKELASYYPLSGKKKSPLYAGFENKITSGSAAVAVGRHEPSRRLVSPLSQDDPQDGSEMANHWRMAGDVAVVALFSGFVAVDSKELSKLLHKT